MSHDVRKPVFGVLTWSDTNLPEQSKRMARGLKFRLYVEEVLYYPNSENFPVNLLDCCVLVFA